MGAKVKVVKGYLHFRLFWKSWHWWQKTGFKDTPEARRRVEADAVAISRQMQDGRFNYLDWFPNGNRAHLFRRQEAELPSSLTMDSFYEKWLPAQEESQRPHRVKDYKSIKKHCLTTRVDNGRFGAIPVALVGASDLKQLQSKLLAKGLKARSVNSVIHSCLAAMLRDARASGVLKSNPYDKIFFKRLPETDSKPAIDPYTPEERNIILEEFRTKHAHFYPFVFFQFWTGARPSETTSLRRGDLDLRYSRATFHRSRVQGHEGGSKNRSSNRTIELDKSIVKVLKAHAPLRVKPEDYVFQTPAGTPIDENNFYSRQWLAVLRCKSIRPRPFYNTRHSYVSFMYSVGAPSGRISSDTGDSIKTLEKDYARYIKEADRSRDLVSKEIAVSQRKVRTR